MIKRVVTATEARVHFGELMRQVVEQNQAVIVERDGVPQVVVISVAEYDQLNATGANKRHREALRRMGELAASILERRHGEPLTRADDAINESRELRNAEQGGWLDLH